MHIEKEKDRHFLIYKCVTIKTGVCLVEVNILAIVVVVVFWGGVMQEYEVSEGGHSEKKCG